MPDPCKEKADILRDANKDLAGDEREMKDALEALEEATGNLENTFWVGVVGTAVASAAGPAGTIGAGAAAAGAIKGAEYMYNSAARAVINAKEDWIEAQGLVEIAENNLEHCISDNKDEDGDGVRAKDDPHDDMPEGDEDADMPMGDADWENIDFDEEGSQPEDEEPVVVECTVCGYYGDIDDFGDEDDLTCPYCETELAFVSP